MATRVRALHIDSNDTFDSQSPLQSATRFTICRQTLLLRKVQIAQLRPIAIIPSLCIQIKHETITTVQMFVLSIRGLSRLRQVYNG